MIFKHLLAGNNTMLNRLTKEAVVRELERIEALEDEAIDKFQRKIMALRRDKATLREELERGPRRVEVVKQVLNPLRREQFRRV
jgi:hypothetical protein